jgi:predicted dehydrogenase
MKIVFLSCAHVHTISYVNCLKKSGIVDDISLFDYNMENASVFSKNNHVNFHNNIDEALKDSDGVIVCAANAEHLKYIKEASRYNIPILCEKPLATIKEDADSIIDIIGETGASLHMALPVRYTRQAIMLRKMIKYSVFGDIVSMSGTNHGTLPEGWFRSLKLAGGGSIMDHGPHVIDLIRWVTGHEISNVYAITSNRYNGLEIEDSALISMEMDNGIIAHLDPSYSRGSYFPTWGDVTLNVEGTKMSAYFDFLGNKLDLYSLKSKNSHRYVGYDTDMDFNMIRDFLDIVRNENRSNHSMLATLDDGYREMMVILAAYKSAKERRQVKVEQ